MLKFLEIYICDVIKGKKKGIIPFFLKGFLRIFSWFFKTGVYLRNQAFDKGWLRRYTPPVPVVISVGNIVAGGTGKTPVTLSLAQHFADEYSIAILSRGYRSQAENLACPVVLSKGEGPVYPPAYCGDEPYLLSQNLPKALVFVGKDRRTASNMAAKAGAQLILLDDGMQHRRLVRDYEVIVLDAHDPFGKDYFLPRGFLREGLKSLSRADLIVLNHVKDREHFDKLSAKIAPYSKANIVGTFMQVAQIIDFQGNVIDNIEDKKVALFCGIAHPEHFYDTVSSLNAEIVYQTHVPDHREFDCDSFEKFARHSISKGAEWLICTEKDRVKLNPLLVKQFPVAWIKLKLAFIEGESHWQAFIQKAKNDLKQRA